jgi:hypothetical protein
VQNEASWLFLLPPAWFVGVERWILGNATPFYERLALTGVVCTAAVAVVASMCYLTLDRRFDRVMTGQGGRAGGVGLPGRVSQGRVSSQAGTRSRWMLLPPPAYVAVRRFTSATLARSGLHQLAACAAVAAGMSLALNGVMLNVGARHIWLVRAAIGGPLTAMIVAVLGLRYTLLLPTNLRAAWIFRTTERDDTRARQLDAVRHTLWVRAVVIPILLLAPVQALILGANATIAAIPLIAALGWVLVELVIHGWRRIPFTCTVLFGKRPAPHSLMALFALFFVFSTIRTAVVYAALQSGGAWVMTMAGVLSVAGVLRRHRLLTWGRLPLEFEDYLRGGIEVLKTQMTE